jgi:type II secretory pathway component GspD/PulD (secretin)
MSKRCQLALALCAVCCCGGVRAQQQTDAMPVDAGHAPITAKPPSAHAREAAEKHYLEGAKQLEKGNLKAAEANFDRAVELDPGNQRYEASREIVLEHETTELIQAADKAKIQNHPDEARQDLMEAFRLDPKNPMLTQHVDEIANGGRPAPLALYPAAEEKAAPPIEFAPLAQRQSFHLRASANELIRQVLSAYGIAATFDSSVKNQQARLDADNIDFAEARRMLNLVTDTFFVPIDPKRALVAADTKEKRAEFERMSLETVYFPGLTAAETTEMANVAKNVFDAQQAITSPSSSTLTLRAPAVKLAALNETLSEMLEGRSEVEVDVHLYNLAKTRTTNIGVQLPTQTTVFNVPTELNSVLQNNQSLVQQIISSGLASAGDYAAIAAILIASGQISSTILSQPFATFGNGLTLTGLAPGSVSGNLLLNSSDSRSLDQVTMRVEDQQESTLKSGTRYPIITSTYSSLSGSSLNIPGISSAGLSSTLAGLGISASSLTSAASQTIPQVQYEDLGLTLKVKPYVQKDRDVTLNLDLKITSLSGAVLNNIPVLENQQYTAIITLKEGASAVVVSNLSKQQSSAVSGIPGLSELPGFQSTTNVNGENDISTLLIVITPHLLRVAHRDEAGRMMVLPVHE